MSATFRNSLFIGLCIILAGIFFLNRFYKEPAFHSNRLQVTTSFYPLFYFSSVIGGDKADVKNITPAGAEPHDYEPTAQDIARVEKSDILILNGGVEAWGDKIQQNLKGSNVEILTAGAGLLTQNVTEDGRSVIDPHIWLDPQRAKKEVSRITQAYITKDPKNKRYYLKNETGLENKLDQLDSSYKTGLANCKLKDIVTSHAAFGYLATTYKLRQVPIAGLSPDAEPSSQQLADIVTFAKRNNVKYIFFESLISPKLAQTIAQEIGAKTLVLDPIEGIAQDDIVNGKNYFTVMQANLINLQTALQCTK